MPDAVDSDSSRTRESSSPARFGRDVAVNVIANLIAAAIVYLLAAAAGLIPQNPALLSTAVAVIAGAVGGALAMWRWDELWGRAMFRQRLPALIGVAIIVAAGPAAVFLFGLPQKELERYIILVSLAAFIPLAISFGAAIYVAASFGRGYSGRGKSAKSRKLP